MNKLSSLLSSPFAWQIAIFALPHYRRRDDALLLCSGWVQVFPSCYLHQSLSSELSLKTEYNYSVLLLFSLLG